MHNFAGTACGPGEKAAKRRPPEGKSGIDSTLQRLEEKKRGFRFAVRAASCFVSLAMKTQMSNIA